MQFDSKSVNIYVYIVRTDGMDIDPYHWSSLYTVTYTEHQQMTYVTVR